MSSQRDSIIPLSVKGKVIPNPNLERKKKDKRKNKKEIFKIYVANNVT